MSILRTEVPRVFVPLEAHARYLGAHGGRGSGKSHYFAEKLIRKGIAEKTDAVCIREVQKTLDQSVKKLLELKIQALDAGWYFEVQDSRIKTKHGGQIIFQGMQNHTADSIKSLEGYDVAWVEEAQTLSQKSLDLLRPTIRKEGSELWFSWNPNNPDDPVDKLLRGPVPPPESVVVQANYMDNPWLPEELKMEIEYDQKRDPDKFKHVWLGDYSLNSEKRVFKNWIVEDFDAPKGTVFRLGADWGFSVDPSVLVRCYIDGRRLCIDYEAYMVGCEIDNLPMLFQRVPESDKWFITADSARPETIEYLQRHGYPRINAAIKGAKSLDEGIQFMQSFDIVVHPRCKHVIDELTLYSYKTDDLTGKIIPILEDKNNHCIDAIRYACEGARRASKQSQDAIKYPNYGIV